MARGTAISLYLKEETLRALDEYVKRQAECDRNQGLRGYDVASRSKVVAEILDDFFKAQEAALPSIQHIQETVRPLAVEYGVERLSLFGSYARGEETATSDIDLLLDKGEVRGMQVFGLKDDLEYALGKQVDIVTTQGASERLLARIKEDEVVLYEARRAG